MDSDDDEDEVNDEVEMPELNTEVQIFDNPSSDEETKTNFIGNKLCNLMPSLSPGNENIPPVSPTDQESQAFQSQQTAEVISAPMGPATKRVPPPRRRFRGTYEETVVIKRRFFCRVCTAEVSGTEKLMEHLNTEHGIKVRNPPSIVRASERDEVGENAKIFSLFDPIDHEKSQPSTSLSNTLPSTRISKNVEKKDKCPRFTPSITPTSSRSCKDNKKLKHDISKKPIKIRNPTSVRCKHCKSDFMDKGRYDVHMKLHRDGKLFDCKYCGSYFLHRFTLHTHLRGFEKAPNDRHKCSKCDSVFVNRTCYLFHLTCHDNLHHCPTCEMIFKFSYQLNSHVKKKHSGSLRTHCPHCNNEFKDSKVLQTHISKVHYKVICKYCNAAFTDEVQRNRHAARMHSEKPLERERPFRCTICQMTLTAQAYLTRHYRKSHNMDPPTSPNKENPIDNQPSPKKVVKPETVTRKKTFNSELYRMAKKLKTRKINQVKRKIQNSKPPTAAKAIDKCTCLNCGILFANESNMRRHMVQNCQFTIVRTDVVLPAVVCPVVVCPQCQGVFKNENGLSRHILLVHAKKSDKKYPCPDCDRSYTQSGNLERHKRNSHTARKLSLKTKKKKKKLYYSRL